METLVIKSVGQIVAENYNVGDIFEKYGIDYYNSGKQSLESAAETGKLDIQSLVKEIEETAPAVGEDSLYNDWDLDVLSDYIVRVHHKYAEKQIQAIKPMLEALVNEQGTSYPELSEIKQLFDLAAGGIASHQKKEELMLFPFIKKMVDAKKNNKPFIRPPLTKSAESPVNMLTHEHNQQGEVFKKITELTKDYTILAGSENDYGEILNLLKEFQLKLHKHLHLENNILFPKALNMDKELAK